MILLSYQNTRPYINVHIIAPGYHCRREKLPDTCELETSTCDGELNEVPCRGLESTPVILSSQGVGS